MFRKKFCYCKHFYVCYKISHSFVFIIISGLLICLQLKEGSKFNTEKELSFYISSEVNNEHQLQIRKRLKNENYKRQRLKIATEP